MKHAYTLLFVSLAALWLLAACGPAVDTSGLQKAQDLLMQGQESAAAKDYATAIELYTQAIELNELSADTYAGRGLAYRYNDQLDLAIADYNKAIELDGENPAFYKGRGSVNGMLREYQTALDDYNTAISLDPEYADAYWGRALAKQNISDLQGAVDDYKKYLELEPYSPQRADFEQLISQIEDFLAHPPTLNAQPPATAVP